MTYPQRPRRSRGVNTPDRGVPVDEMKDLRDFVAARRGWTIQPADRTAWLLARRAVVAPIIGTVQLYVGPAGKLPGKWVAWAKIDSGEPVAEWYDRRDAVADEVAAAERALVVLDEIEACGNDAAWARDVVTCRLKLRQVIFLGKVFRIESYGAPVNIVEKIIHRMTGEHILVDQWRIRS